MQIRLETAEEDCKDRSSQSYAQWQLLLTQLGKADQVGTR